MKVSNVIISCTDSDLYASYWPYASKVWDHFGINPVLLHISNTPLKYTATFGTVITVPPIKDVMLGYQAVTARFLFAAVLPGTNLVYDIDMFPCNTGLLDQILSAPEESLFTRAHIRSIFKTGRLPGGSLCASSNIFRAMFEENRIYPTPTSFWNAEILQAIDRIIPKHEYGSDEVLITRCLCSMKQSPMIVSSISPPNAIVEISASTGIINDWEISAKQLMVIDDPPYNPFWNFESLKTGKYQEIHIRRDISKKLTAQVCNIILNGESK